MSAETIPAKRAGYALPVLMGLLIGVAGFFLVTTPPHSGPKLPLIDDLRGRKPMEAPFHNCAEARAAGAAPVYESDPRYAPWLDGDHDGIGCEP